MQWSYLPRSTRPPHCSGVIYHGRQGHRIAGRSSTMVDRAIALQWSYLPWSIGPTHCNGAIDQKRNLRHFSGGTFALRRNLRHFSYGTFAVIGVTDLSNKMNNSTLQLHSTTKLLQLQLETRTTTALSLREATPLIRSFKTNRLLLLHRCLAGMGRRNNA